MDKNKLKSLEVKDLKKAKLELSPIIIKHIQLFLFPVVTVLIVAILSWYFLLPQVTEIQSAFEENRQNEEILTKLETKRERLVQIKNSTILTDFERLEEVLPSEKKVPVLINTLQSVQRDQEVIYESLSIKPGIIDDSASEVEPIKFNINVGGPPEKVISYVGELLNTIPITNANSLTLNTYDGFTRAVLSVESYYYPLPVTLGAIDASLPVLSKGAEQSVQTALTFKDPPILIDIPVGGTPSGGVTNKVSIFNL